LNKIPVFRIFFNTSFAKNNFIRFSKASLDLDEESDDIIPNNFFIDILFSPFKNQNENVNEEINLYWHLIGEIIQKKISNRLNNLSPKKELNISDLETKNKLFLIGSPQYENYNKEKEIKESKEGKANPIIYEDYQDNPKKLAEPSQTKEVSNNAESLMNNLKEKGKKEFEMKEENSKENDNMKDKEETPEDDNEEKEDVENYIANLEKSLK